MPQPILACNLEAIPAPDRPRYRELVTRVREAMHHRIEIPTGYSYQLNPAIIAADETQEWIEMERRCCPFLSLQLTGSQLALTGPEGIKPLLDAEFPA